ncbi:MULTISPECIES: CHAT domain-containing protein [unclassified Streptomyces]|uniref:CHAT domain-containing protein n=1 Tax=unclassified Streptomyces TaxID=2593676 RepID=UPI0004BD90E2|nr:MULTISPECIES: CHAT domain-containing protein [unclassified Streptomyces]
MAGDDGMAGDDRTVIDWRPVNGPWDAGLRPAQVVARRSRMVRLPPALERSREATALRKRLAAAEAGDPGALLSPDARKEWTGLRLRRPPAETDPGGLPLVVMAVWCRVLAGEETGRDTSDDEKETVAWGTLLYGCDSSLVPPELVDPVLLRGPALLVEAAERTGDIAVLTDAARLLRHCFERFRREESLTHAQQLLERVRQEPRVGRPHSFAAAVALVQVLAARFDHTGEALALERAAGVLADLERGTAPSERADVAELGCLIYRLRYELHGDSADLDRAVDAGAESLRLTGAPSVRNNLALARWQRFVVRGERGDLDDAIRGQLELLAATDPEASAWPGRAANLAGMLHRAHRHTGSLDYLDQAVGHAASAVERTPAGHSDLGGFRSNLAVMLRDRFVAQGADEDLLLALEQLRQAVAETPPGSRHHAGFLANLGATHALRHRVLGNVADLDAAVQALFRAAGSGVAGSVHHAARVADLAEALRTKAGQSDSAILLDQAVETAEEALAESDESGEAGVSRLTLGRALADRWRRTGNTDDLSAARVQLAHAADAESAPPLQRAKAAQELARLLAGHDWAASAAAAASALRSFDALVDHRVDRPGRLRHLAELQGLARDGAAAALAADDRELAIGLLEQGRGVLISQALQSRQDLSAVRAYDSTLAEELVVLGHALAAEELATRGREALARRWEVALGRVRKIPGQGSFGAVPSPAELRAVAQAGPIVHVNVSRYRVDAVVLTESVVDVLPLTGLDAAAVETAAARVAEATGAPAWGTNNMLHEVLEELWDALCGPVLRRLEELTGRSGGQMWWVPSGALALLPLVAAGLHRDASDGDRSLRERWVMSLAPTVRALRRQRETAAVRLDTAHPLIVAVPGEGKAQLREALAEAREVASALGSPGHPLLAEEATTAAVIAAVPDCTCAHLACHAVSEPDPLESRLLLADGPLTVRDLLGLRPANASLAFLSACTTADAGRELADEALHLATAFQLSGYPHVIGTLWQVSDDMALRMARSVYAALAAASPARALHKTVCAASREHAESPFDWASYVHLGP